MESWLKILHLLASCLFIGNIVVSAAWKVMADRSGQLHLIQFATRLVNLTDAVFTLGGVVLLVITGHLMAGQFGGLSTSWILSAYACLALSGAIWLAVLVPVQLKQARLLASLDPQSDTLPDSYDRLARRWAIAGVVSTLFALMALYFMVVKPG